MTKALPLFLAPLLLTIGCAASTGEEAETETGDTEVTGETAQALVSPEYEAWGHDDVNLWNSALAFCYLTSVSGNLLPRTGDFEIGRGVGLGVRDGMWHLYTSDASARARCAQWGDFKYAGSGKLVSSPDGWASSSTAPARQLWGTSSLCFMSGAGQGYDGGAQRMSVTPGVEGWSLKTTGTTVDSGFFLFASRDLVWARGNAMCIDTQRSTPWRITNHAWSQGNPQTWMMPASDGVCMLTGIGGKFAGAGERVEIVEDSGWWVLRGQSMQHGVQATAQCVPYSQLVLTKPILISPIGG
jgi:hypothetical protein